jgi:transcriptional regulator with XRE-family HTH domain
VTADMSRFARRITELRGAMTKAQLARRAGISPAYLTGVENPASGKRPSVPVIRGIADAIPGASRSELLELAGYEEDAVYDKVKEMKAERSPEPAELSTPEMLELIRRTAEALVERFQVLEGPTPVPETRASPVEQLDRLRKGTRGTRQRA